MATSTQSLITSNTTDAAFRTWGSGVAAGLAAAGLTKTSDTGQINWTTVTKPTSTNTVAGYEIYQFNDALQSTHSVYIRVEYSSAASANSASLNIQTGTATNGAGTLSGQVSTKFNMATIGSATATDFYFSGDGSRIAMVGGLSISSTNNNICWCVERIRSSSGANTADGHFLFVNAAGVSGSPAYHQVVPASGAVLTQTNGRAIWPSPGSSLSLGSNLYLACLHPYSYQVHNPVTSFVQYFSTDLTTGTNFTANMYSTTMTFRPLGAIYPDGSTSCQFRKNAAIAIRWE